MLCAHYSLVQYKIPERRSPGKRIDARAQHQEAYASDGQRPRMKISARIKKEERDESVKVEDVAMVKKITVQDAEQDQPHVAPKVNIGCPSLSQALLNAASEQDDARTEEQGEQRTHLAFHDQPACEPHSGIRGAVRSSEDRLGRTRRHQIVPARQAEVGDIGDEDAQQSNATEHVHTGEALLTLDWGKSRRRACKLFLVNGSAVALH